MHRLFLITERNDNSESYKLPHVIFGICNKVRFKIVGIIIPTNAFYQAYISLDSELLQLVAVLGGSRSHWGSVLYLETRYDLNVCVPPKSC